MTNIPDAIRSYLGMGGVKRAVCAIRAVELALGLEQTAEYKPWYGYSVVGLIIATIVACIAGAYVL